MHLSLQLASILLTTFLTPTDCLSILPFDEQIPIQPSTLRGIPIPSLGLGLWNSHASNATHAVSVALTTGYTHFDSAAAYSNEGFVGAGFANTTLPRHKYWLTSKLWNDAHQPDLVPAAIARTLQALNTTHLDLYLMHWPVAFKPNTGSRTIIDQDTSILDTWRAMEELVRQNLTRYIGVSNFSPRQLDALLANCEICPFAHEFETHPYLQQQDFVDWHAQKDIKVIAYSPLANLNPTYNGTHDDIPSILDDSFWLDLAKRYNATVPQAVLSWGKQRGTIVIPKSVHRKYIEENFESEVKFNETEMLRIAEQDRRTRFNNPSKSWGVELFEGLDDGSNRFLVGELRR